MKKSTIVISFACMLFLFSCLKDKPNVDFDQNKGYITEISTASTNSTPQAPSGGIAYLSGATIATSVASDPDDEFFTVNVASQYPPTMDVPVTLALDDAARAAYNASTPDYTYDALPSEAFAFPATAGTVHAGRRLDTFNITFMHDKMDPTKDYMLPITVKSAPGTTISGNMSTIYFHIVGNLLAVNLNHYYKQWNAADSSGTPAISSPEETVFMDPSAPTEVDPNSGYTEGGKQPLNYVLTFARSGNSLNTFSIAFNTDLKALQKKGDTVVAGPSLLNADFANGVYRFGYQLNTADGPKYVIDQFYK